MIMNPIKNAKLTPSPADRTKSSMIVDQASPVRSTNTVRNDWKKLLKLFNGYVPFSISTTSAAVILQL